MNLSPIKEKPKTKAVIQAYWDRDLRYIVDGAIKGKIEHQDDGFAWSCPKFNSTGHCMTLERAKWWVVYYAEKV